MCIADVIDTSLPTPSVPEAAAYASTFKDVGSNTFAVTSELVKGVGYAHGGSKPENDWSKLAPLVHDAEKALRAATKRGITAPSEVMKGVNPSFMPIMNAFMATNPTAAGIDRFVSQLNQELSAALGKDISLTSPLSSGIVPFDLVAPSRLIYPVKAQAA